MAPGKHWPLASVLCSSSASAWDSLGPSPSPVQGEHGWAEGDPAPHWACSRHSTIPTSVRHSTKDCGGSDVSAVDQVWGQESCPCHRLSSGCPRHHHHHHQVTSVTLEVVHRVPDTPKSALGKSPSLHPISPPGSSPFLTPMSSLLGLKLPSPWKEPSKGCSG